MLTIMARPGAGAEAQAARETYMSLDRTNKQEFIKEWMLHSKKGKGTVVVRRTVRAGHLEDRVLKAVAGRHVSHTGRHIGAVGPNCDNV